MVEVECRSARAARWWKGQAPQTTTGVASTKHSHCQLRNCQAGTIDRTSTGTASRTVTLSRWRSCSVSVSSSSPSSGRRASGGSGSVAVYPACSTAATSCSGSTSGGWCTRARPVARFTLAVTPSSLASFFSTRFTQAAQVMPPTTRSVASTTDAGSPTISVRSRGSCRPCRRLPCPCRRPHGRPG